MESAAPIAELSHAARWRAYVVSVLGWLFDFYDLVVFAYLARAIGTEWHWGAEFNRNKAMLVGVTLAASGVGGIVFGGLADRFGRRSVMAWTILMYSVSTGLCGLAPSIVWLACLRALTGLGVGGEWATGHTLMAEIFPKEMRGRAAAMLQAGEPVGVALAVVAGLWLEPRVGWRAVFFVSALPALLVMLVRRHTPESPLWLARPRQPFLAPYRILVRDYWRPALQGWVLGCSKLGTYWLTYIWLPDYFTELEQTGHAGAHFSAIRIPFILVAQGGQLIGMLIFGHVADRFGRRPAFTAYSLLTAAGLFALSQFGDQMLARPNLFWPAMAAVGFGSGCTAGFGALLAELFPTGIRNTAMGAVYNMARAFQFVTQMAMAAIAAYAGIAQGLLLAMALALVTAGWVWTFRETKGEALA